MLVRHDTPSATDSFVGAELLASSSCELAVLVRAELTLVLVRGLVDRLRLADVWAHQAEGDHPLVVGCAGVSSRVDSHGRQAQCRLRRSPTRSGVTRCICPGPK